MPLRLACAYLTLCTPGHQANPDEYKLRERMAEVLRCTSASPGGSSASTSMTASTSSSSFPSVSSSPVPPELLCTPCEEDEPSDVQLDALRL